MKSLPPLNRRQFLGSAAAMVATPWVLSAQEAARVRGANNRIGIAFLGTGKQTGHLMNSLIRRPTVQVVAVCDVDTSRREHFQQAARKHYADQSDAGAYRGVDAVRDFRELLERSDVDAVVIATPDHWHAAMATAAARAGKDIYCEKPLCQSIAEADAMVAAVRSHNVVFQTGSQQRSSREFRLACELVRNRVLGKLTGVEVAVGGPAVPCDLPEEEMEPGLDWDLWLGPALKRPYNSVLSPRGVHNHFPNWRNYREFGGGGVTDWGAHHFDIAQWGLGRDGEGPVEVLPAESPEASHGVRLRYEDGVEVLHRGQGNGVWFMGEDGKIFVSRGRFEFQLGDRKVADSPAAHETVEKEFLSEKKVSLYESTDHIGDWLARIQDRRRPICDVAIGASTVKVCHLVNLAYYHGQLLKWDPRQSRFLDGTGEAKWLDVPHRDPWQV